MHRIGGGSWLSRGKARIQAGESERRHRIPSWLRDGTGGAGAVAALITTLCCLGVPALVGLVSALGAGFLLNDRYLAPLLVATLLFTVVSAGWHARTHRRLGPLVLSVLAAGLVFWAIYSPALGAGGATGHMADSMAPLALWRPWLAYGAVGVLLLTQIWDLRLLRRCARNVSAPADGSAC